MRIKSGWPRTPMLSHEGRPSSVAPTRDDRRLYSHDTTSSTIRQQSLELVAPHHENFAWVSRPLRVSLRNCALRLPRRGRYSYKPLRGSSKLFHPTSPPCESDITGLPACRSCAVCSFWRRSPIISRHQRQLGDP